MFKTEIIIRIALLLCSCAGFVYGAYQYFRKKAPLFNQIVVCAVGCMMLARIFDIVMLFVRGSIPNGFYLGRLGIFGGFMFIFSASFGQMDGLVDGHEPVYRKYRLIALGAPAVIILLYLPIFIWAENIGNVIFNGILTAILALASYYNLKHLIIPDIDFGILKNIRDYNLVSLILSFLTAVEAIGVSLKISILKYITLILICVVYLIIIPVLKKGSAKWIL